MATLRVPQSPPYPIEDAQELHTAFEGPIFSCSLKHARFHAHTRTISHNDIPKHASANIAQTHAQTVPPCIHSPVE